MLFGTEFNESDAAISPDGGWIADNSNETGQAEVYVQRFPALGGKVAISTDGGVQPLWSSDGDELFYLGPRGMMTVPVETDPTSAQAIPRCCSSNRLAATAHVALTTLPPTAGS